MYTLFCFAMIIYYPIAISLYFRKERRQRFFHSIFFPLPIVIYVGSLVIEEADEGNFDTLARSLIFVSSFIGLGVLVHCYLERKSREPLFIIRMIASIILVANPLLLYFPVYYPVMIGLFFFSGFLLGFYGNIAYSSGKQVGLVYIYASIIFMVLIPAFTYALSQVYTDFVDKIVVYRRAPDGMSCHSLPGDPIIPPWESFKTPFLFSSLYAGIAMVQGRIMRWWLVRDMTGKGKLPQEFLDILKSRDPEGVPEKSLEGVKWNEGSK